MATESVRPGVVLDGKYEILNLLGAGGMGEVFKARHVHLNAFRCIKVMKQGLLADEMYRTRFLREAQLATQIHHPNIAVVHDFFLAERGSYMVTEFIDGTTVRQWSKAFGSFPLPLAADVAVQVLAGLDHIHRRGLLHRDISADNIMLSYERDDSLLAKIIDLGIAKDVNVVSNETMAGMLVGNPKYMSPEQLGDLAAGEQVDHRADLYCLGVVLYEMLLGVPPFVSETPHGYIVKHLTHAPRAFATVAPGVEWPEGLEAVIFRALEKDRHNRYADARAFSAALQPFLSVPPGSLTKTAVERLRRMPDKTLVEKLPEAATEVTPAAPTETETERDWKKTVAQDSVSGYREYIERHPHAPDTTEAKARLFELSLLADVREREKEADRDALQRLAEGHPPGSLVGNAARDALTRLRNAQEEAQAEENDFQRAWEIGTSAGWRQFIDKYAASPRAARAQEFLDEAVSFEEASGIESDTGVRQFLKVWPDGRHHLEAEIRLVALKQRLADAAFAQAAAFDTAAAWRDFLTRFPLATQAEEAQRSLTERLAFESATTADTHAAWTSYLAAWGSDRHADEARVRLAVIAEASRKLEPRDWDAAWEAGSVAAWDRYLAEQPDSERAAEARLCRQEAVDFELAVTTASASMWRAFLKAWPEGRHRLDAEVRLRGAK
jgi:serine/threonine protein kinase